MTELTQKQCIACQGGIPPLQEAEIKPYLEKINPSWKVVNNHHLEREWTFEDFQQALDFTNNIGAIAEQEGHHPDIFLTWGKVKINIFTHKINGLHQNDFILAAKIDQLQ